MARARKKRLTLLHLIVGAVVVYVLVIAMLAGLNTVGKAANTDIFRSRQVTCTYNVQAAKQTVTGDFNTGICVFYHGERFVFLIDTILHNAVRLVQYNPDRLFIFNPGMMRQIDLDGDDDPDISFTLMDINNRGSTFEVHIFGYPEELSMPVQPVKEEPTQFQPEQVTVPVTAQQEIPPMQAQENRAAQAWNVIVLIGIFLTFAVIIVAVVKRKSVFHQ